MPLTQAKGDAPHGAENTHSKRGRKRRRAREMPTMAWRQVPLELQECGDIERVAEEWNVSKVEGLAMAVTYVLRKLPQLERALRVVPITDGRAA